MTDYLSVSEYALVHNKDKGNIRRLLISGRLKGQKVGNQWIIPADTLYPEDKRVKNGKYYKWRNRLALNKHKNLMDTIYKMNETLCSIYGDLLYEIVLYGSYARGTQTEESDVDIALILFKKPEKELTDKMISCVAKNELECEKILSVIEIDYEMFKKWKKTLPFYRNISREGIVLWESMT